MILGFSAKLVILLWSTCMFHSGGLSSQNGMAQESLDDLEHPEAIICKLDMHRCRKTHRGHWFAEKLL